MSKDPYTYFCSVCDHSFTRKKSAQDHAVKHASTHPLGKDTPVIKRLKSEMPIKAAADDATSLMRDFVTVVSRLSTVLDADPELCALGRRLVAALEPRGEGHDPACEFALEPIPPKEQLKRRLLDVFKNGVVPHLVWTHVHKHGTVRSSERDGCLQVFGVHGWTTMPSAEVARQSIERMQTRLQKMWMALERDDPKVAGVLRPAMRQFAAKKTIFMDGDAFGMEADVSESKDSASQVLQDLEKSLIEYVQVEI